MKVLIACEESQEVCKRFRAKGHEAYSCDIQPCSGGHPEWHFQDDVFKVIDRGWDLMIAHPPCTYLTVAANRWFKDQPQRESGVLVGEERRTAQVEAIDFFTKLWKADIHKIAVENPIGCMSRIIGRPHQIIHPYYFGDTASKATCLWLKNLPPLNYYLEDTLFAKKTAVEPEIYVTKSGRKYDKWSMIDACRIKTQAERAKFRSKTFPGIAQAMADQWG